MPAGILLNLTAGLPLPIQFLLFLLEAPVIAFERLGFTEIGKGILYLELELAFPVSQLIQLVLGKAVNQLQQALCLAHAAVINVRFGQSVELLLTVKAERQIVEEGLGISQLSVMDCWAAVLPNNAVLDPLLSLIHISEPTRRTPISYAVF